MTEDIEKNIEAIEEEKREYLESHPEEIEEAFANDGRYVNEEDDETDNTFNQFSSKRIQSAHGRTYHHLMNHMKKGAKRGGGANQGRGFY